MDAAEHSGADATGADGAFCHLCHGQLAVVPDSYCHFLLYILYGGQFLLLPDEQRPGHDAGGRVERGGRRTGETRGTRSDGSDGQGRGAMDSQGQISQGRHHQSGGGSRDRHPALSADGMGQGKCLRVV